MNDKARFERSPGCGCTRLRRRGISIVEVLTVVSVLAILMSLLLPMTAALKQNARMTVEQSVSKQLVQAYISYSASHQDELMPAHKLHVKAWDRYGDPIDDVAATTYVWRLAPYLDHAIDLLFPNERAELLEEFRNPPNNDTSRYHRMVSMYPSIGINALWLGGDHEHHAWDDLFLDIYGRYYAVRMSQIRQPDRIITFASSRAGDTPVPAPKKAGFHKVLSPKFYTNLWREAYHVPGDIGYVHPRYGGSAVTARLDGHVEVMGLEKMWDMRHWANQATCAEWDLEPLDVPHPPGGGCN